MGLFLNILSLVPSGINENLQSNGVVFCACADVKEDTASTSSSACQPNFQHLLSSLFPLDYVKFWSWSCGRNTLGGAERENKNIGPSNVYSKNCWTGDCKWPVGKDTTGMGIAEY